MRIPKRMPSYPICMKIGTNVAAFFFSIHSPTEVEWSTIKTIAGFNALDTWILFPTSAIARMLPRSKKPDDIGVGWVNRLTKVFGDESWRNLYQETPQGNLFGKH